MRESTSTPGFASILFPEARNERVYEGEDDQWGNRESVTARHSESNNTLAAVHHYTKE